MNPQDEKSLNYRVYLVIRILIQFVSNSVRMGLFSSMIGATLVYAILLTIFLSPQGQDVILPAPIMFFYKLFWGWFRKYSYLI